MNYNKLLIKLLPLMQESKSIVEIVEDELDEIAERYGLDGGAKILKDLGLSDGDLETFGFNPQDVSDNVEIRKCEHCNKDLWKGHVMYPETLHTFYLCEDDFNKFYTKEMGKDMYENGLQYYTEWEED